MGNSKQKQQEKRRGRRGIYPNTNIAKHFSSLVCICRGHDGHNDSTPSVPSVVSTYPPSKTTPTPKAESITSSHPRGRCKYSRDYFYCPFQTLCSINLQFLACKSFIYLHIRSS